jgi:Arc/MetJ family transcription regulator
MAAAAVAAKDTISPRLKLTFMHKSCILMHMRTTLNIDESLLGRAARLTGIKKKTALVHLGLEALVARESARRLAELGGTEQKLGPIRRRRGKQ